MGVELLASVQRNPSRTGAEVHRMLGRRHPRLVAQFARSYDSTPVAPDTDQPTIIFRGIACIACERRLDSEVALNTGLCSTHHV